MLYIYLQSKMRMPAQRRILAIGFSLAVVLTLLFTGLQSQAATVLQPWVPIFKGVDHAVGTNTPGGGGFAELQVYLARHAEFARWLIRHGRAHDPAARRG